MRALAAVILCFATTAASAEGFAVKDLTSVADEAKAIAGEGYVHRAAAQRLTLACLACKGAPMIDVLLGRLDDGTEQRVRSGETTIARLEQQCQQNSPTCRLGGLKVAPAVGWISTYPVGASTFGSTAVIVRDGDLLTIRSIASDAGLARANAQKLASELAPKIVGR